MATRILSVTLEREMLRLWPDKHIPFGGQRELARKYGISESRVQNIARTRGFTSPRRPRKDATDD